MDQEEELQKSVFKDKETQRVLNTPLSALETAEAPNEKDTNFLNQVISFIEDKRINLLDPDTLINHDFCDTLPEEKKGKADTESVNLLASLREIKALYDQGFHETYQMKNLVLRVRQTKERIEAEGGDIFII
jgi:hypothetical protein